MAKGHVILYSTSLHTWEVWAGGRPVGEGTLSGCKAAYPDAPEPSETQYMLERNDQPPEALLRQAAAVLDGHVKDGTTITLDSETSEALATWLLGLAGRVENRTRPNTPESKANLGEALTVANSIMRESGYR